MNKILAILITCCLILAATSIGAVEIQLSMVWDAFIHLPRDQWPQDATIFLLRLPRVVLAFFAGALLAQSGGIFQTLFRNPLATPYTLGLSTAAGFGAFLGIMFPWGIFGMGTAALVMALIHTWLLLIFYNWIGRHMGRLLLAGVMLNYFFGALIMLFQYLADPLQIQQVTYFFMGSLHFYPWWQVILLGIASLILAIVCYSMAPRLDQMALGDDIAHGRGVMVEKTRFSLLILCGIALALCVSMTGPISFIGLVIPHIIRYWTKGNHRKMLPTAFFAGGWFLITCDTLGRSLTLMGRGAEIPVGLITSALGAPFFIYLLLKQK